MGGGDGCTAVDMYLMSLNCTRKKDSDGKSVLWNERERDGTHGGALMREGCHNALFAVTWGAVKGQIPAALPETAWESMDVRVRAGICS